MFQLSRMIKWIGHVLFPHWVSNKLIRFQDAKSEDFLENYYEELEAPTKEEPDVRT